MAKDSININIGAKDAASSVIHGIQMRTVALGVTIGNLASKAITGMLNGLRNWVSEALEAEKANVMLDAALRGVGNYTPELSKQFRDLANAIQDETRISDESVKANIAQLTTMGVASDKMGVATRAVYALAAMGRDGSLSMVAVGKALEGDISGFERFSPAVRAATTITEKYAAANKMLQAGYEQQKANLQTVGGAWQALQGRLGDAREEIIGAIFAGLKLGTTFDGMQASVGKFLQSESFANFTNALKNGAGYALDIASALTAKGGAAEVASAFGSILLAALKDGGDYIAESMKAVFKGTAIGKAVGWVGDKVGGAARAWGTRAGGGSVEDALAAMDKPSAKVLGGGNLSAAMARFDAVILKSKQTQAVKTAESNAALDAELARQAEQKTRDDMAAEMQAAGLAAQKKLVDAQKAKADGVARTLTFEKQIERHTQAEADAKSTVARNQKRLAELAGKNVAEYIADKASQRESEKARGEAEEKAQRRLANLEGKEARGVKLSKRDQQELADAREQEKLRNAANDAMIAGRKEEVAARRAKDQAEAALKTQRDKNEKNLEKIAKSVEGALEVQN